MLPDVKDHLRLRIPKADLDWNLHVPNRADHNNTRRYLGVISNVLIGPLLRCLAARFLRIPHIELVVIGEDGQTATMARNTHAG